MILLFRGQRTDLIVAREIEILVWYKTYTEADKLGCTGITMWFFLSFPFSVL